MARFLLILLALVAAALPLFAHAYAFETLDGTRGASVETEVMAVNMALAGFPVALAALISHRRRAFRFGLLAFAIEALIWGYSAASGRAVHAATDYAGAVDILRGAVLIGLPVLLAIMVLLGTRRQKAAGLRF